MYSAAGQVWSVFTEAVTEQEGGWREGGAVKEGEGKKEKSKCANARRRERERDRQTEKERDRERERDRENEYGWSTVRDH